MKELLIIALGSALVNNVVLSQFLGICSFLGVSNRLETAKGMSGAVIFVLTLSSLVAALVYKFVLDPLGLDRKFSSGDAQHNSDDESDDNQDDDG